MALSTIWFDFGGVLSPPIAELFVIYQRKTGIAPAQLQAAMAEVARPLGRHPMAAIELALVSEAQWGAALAETLSRLYPGIDLSRSRLERFGSQWFADVPANRAMVALLGEVKAAGYKVGILTNNVVEWETAWRGMLAVDHLLDAVVDSCKVGSRKPEARIFEIACHALKAAPGESLLIDDLEENCAMARAVGWQAIVFRSNEQVIRELRESLATPALPSRVTTGGFFHA